MTEDKKVITIDDVEYTEDQLSDEAKVCINHIGSLDQKIGSAQFNLTHMLKSSLEAKPEEAEVVN
jgi:hypothetical protein